mmetsp:Transcript_31956/g.63374  ORF Transcript_31956/g.63374 Transcript_31956/m.63374 type:complete len:501 (+) Transcript_31956:158-1660(+)
MTSLKILGIREALNMGTRSDGAGSQSKTSSRGDYIRQSLVKIFAKIFFDEEVLGRAAGVTYGELIAFCSVYVEVARREDMSYIALAEGDNVVAFLMVEDVAGPKPEVLKSGIMEELEKATSPSLGKVFNCLESLHDVFKEKVGVDYRNPLRRGTYFHLLAAGAIPEVRGTGVVMAMVAKMYMSLVDRSGGYSGMITEATSFASQRILKKTLLPDYGWVVEKPVTDFLNPDGTLTFPTVQTSTVNLSYQFSASHSSLERTFQEALIFLGSDKTLLTGIPHVALRLYALHTVAVRGFARTEEPRPSVLSPVARAKYEAVEALKREGKDLPAVRRELVDIVTHNFPEWHLSLRNITSVPLSASAQAKMNAALVASIGVSSRSSINLKAVWVPDHIASRCMRCKERSFGPLTRRHHCRVCGLVVCSSCTPTRIPLPANFNVPGLHRACLVCTDATLVDNVSGKQDGRGRANSRHAIRQLSTDTKRSEEVGRGKAWSKAKKKLGF